jgi:hypothetical protein
MKEVKKGLRLLVMVFLLILAAFGVGITGAFLNNNRERYIDNEIRTEQVDKKENEESEDESKT